MVLVMFSTGGQDHRLINGIQRRNDVEKLLPTNVTKIGTKIEYLQVRVGIQEYVEITFSFVLLMVFFRQ